MVPYLDLKAQTASLRTEIEAAIGEVLDSGQFVLGKFVADFESAFANFCRVRHAIAVNSGTSALHLALLAEGVGPGDEVITVPFTFAATVAAIYYANATPVYCDINPRTFNMDATRLESLITPRTKAIVPVHLYGQPADMDTVLAVADRHGIPVIEDAAQAHGAEIRGIRAGSLGRMGCFSFYPTKNLGACGEGGLVTTNDDQLAETLRRLRDWGQDRKYHHLLRGYNYRMEGIQGAILSVKLRYLEQWTEARRCVATWYDAALANTTVIRPFTAPSMRHVYHTYTIRTDGRDELQQYLATNGIQTAIHYGIPTHLQTAYADPRYQRGSLPESESAAEQVLSLPMYPELPRASVEQVAGAIRAWKPGAV